MSEQNRREFLKIGGTVLASAALYNVAAGQPANPNAATPKQAGEMPPAAAKGIMKHTSMMTAMIPGAADKEGNWQLPPLPYDYDALEPHIDAQTMQLHHDKHHLGYVNGLRKAEEKIREATANGNFDMIEHWLMEASFHGGGHFLHCVFWDSMGKQQEPQPTGALGAHIQSSFGGFDQFKSLFTNAASKVKGSGWGVLAFQVASGNLTIMQSQNHNLLSQWGLIPLLCIDVWEHAYYLKYQNDRSGYIKAWWNVVDWGRVGQRFDALLGSASRRG